MMALNTIRNHKNSIALIFAISILAVTACDIVCSIDRSASWSTHNNLATSTHAMDGGKEHNHKQDKSHNHHTSTKDITGHSHSSSSEDQDDDCCKDVTDQFYKSLFNTSNSGIVKSPVNAFILITVLNNYHLVSSSSYLNPRGDIFAIPPNLSGNHLRILYNSFLI